MQSLPCAVLLCLCAAAAAAQSTELTFDLDGDGRPDRMRLVEAAPSMIDLVIEPGAGAPVRASGIAWSGAMGGTEPWLEQAANGSLRLMSQNDAVGRDRWTQTLTIAWRDGAFRVAGVTYSWRDTLQPGAGGTCDLNLMTGAAEWAGAGGKVGFRVPAGAPRVTDWTAESFTLPDACL